MGDSVRISLGVFLVMALACGAYAQEDRVDSLQDVERRFSQALERYQQGHYARARLEFQDFLARFPVNPRSSAARLMLAKAFYKLNQYDRAIEIAEILLADHPSSRYVPYARFVSGDCRYRQDRHGDAAMHYVGALQDAPPGLKERTLVRLGTLSSSGLVQEDLDLLNNAFGARWVEEAMGLGEALWILTWGYTDQARTRARTLLDRFPQGAFREEIRGLLGEAEMGPSLEPRTPGTSTAIGIVCPLSGPDGGLGEDLRDGVRLGLEHFIRLSDRIDLIFEDSKSDPVLAVQRTQKLVEQGGVVGLIGPVRSTSTVGMAASANAARVPLIAATATEDSVAAIGPYVFQLNTTPAVEGCRLAEHAVGALGLRTFAILTSLDGYGQKLSDAFAERARELGAEIIIRESYFPAATDFGPQLLRIREAGLAYATSDTGMAEEMLIDVPEDTVAMEEVTSIDGVVLASHAEEIVLIATQLALHRIETQLLGGSGWNALEVPRQGGRYVDGAIFVSGYHEDPLSSSFRRFVDGFTARFGRRPGIPAAFGYDASAMMIRAVQGGRADREALRDALAGVQGFSGAAGPVSFAADDRANSEVFVLKIERGRIVKAGG